jgi:hypothetical protein
MPTDCADPMSSENAPQLNEKEQNNHSALAQFPPEEKPTSLAAAKENLHKKTCMPRKVKRL